MNSGIRQISGRWRIPGLVDTVPGELRVDDERRTVFLTFCAPLGIHDANKVFPDRVKLPVICGESVDGISYALGECYVSVRQFNFDAKGARAHGTATASYAFEGLRLPLTDSPLEFTRVSVDFGEIVGWARLCNFDSTYDESENPVYSWNNSVGPRELPLGRGREAVFSAKASFVGSPVWGRKLTIEQGVNTDFCYPKLTPFSTIVADIRRVREIITFATGRRMAPLTAEAAVVPFRCSEGTMVPQDRKCKAKVLFGDGLVPDVSVPDVFGYLFTFPELVRVARACEDWGKRFDKLQPALELFLSPMITDEKMIRTQFLSIMQGLELLHAITVGDNELAVAQRLEQRYVRDSSDFGADKQKLFADHAFKDGGRVGLKLRLFDLLYHRGDWKIEYPFGMCFLDFLVKLKDSRDYYTHYNPDEVQKAFTEEELPEVNWFVQAIFRYHMLMQLGFPEDFAYLRMKYGVHGFYGPANKEEWDA